MLILKSCFYWHKQKFFYIFQTKVPTDSIFMKITEISLRKEPYKSFVVHVEHDPFAPLHHHPEYELVLINQGKGKRIVGDNIARFTENDLIFVGPYLPHQWICDKKGDKLSDQTGNEAFAVMFHKVVYDNLY